MALASARRRRESKFMAAFPGRVGLPARLAVRPQSPLSSGARHRTRAARSVPRPRTYSRPRGDRQAWPRRRCRVVTGAASSISRLSPALRDDTTVVATAARAPTASATRSSSSSSPRARLSTATAHTGSEASCALFDRFARSRARRGCNPQNPTAVLPCFGQRDRPLPPRARQRSLRMAAARASSSFQTLVNNN